MPDAATPAFYEERIRHLEAELKQKRGNYVMTKAGTFTAEAIERLVAERRQAQEERDAAFDAAGLPRTASLDDLIRHHRNNAGMAAGGHKIAAEEGEKRAVKAEAERRQAIDALRWLVEIYETRRGDLPRLIQDTDDAILRQAIRSARTVLDAVKP